MTLEDAKRHPLFDKFRVYASTHFLPLEDGWLPWWNCFLAGIEAALED